MSRDPLARLFADIWAVFLDGGDIDGDQLQDMIERTGLAAWSDATAAEVEASQLELEIGDPLLKLTDEGRAVLRRAQEGA